MGGLASQPDNDRNESCNDIRCLAGWTMRFLTPDPLFFATLHDLHSAKSLTNGTKKLIFLLSVHIVFKA